MKKLEKLIVGCLTIILLMSLNGIAIAELNIVMPCEIGNQEFFRSRPLFKLQWIDSNIDENFNYAEEERTDSTDIVLWKNGDFENRITIEVPGVPIYAFGSDPEFIDGIEQGATYNCIVLKKNCLGESIEISAPIYLEFTEAPDGRNAITLVDENNYYTSRKTPVIFTISKMLNRIEHMITNVFISEAHASIALPEIVYGFSPNPVYNRVEISDRNQFTIITLIHYGWYSEFLSVLDENEGSGTYIFTPRPDDSNNPNFHIQHSTNNSGALITRIDLQ